MDNRNYNIVALDPGSANITIAVGRVDEEGKLHIVDIVTKPMQGISRGEVSKRPDVSTSVSEAIREVEERHGKRISDVWLGASGNHIKCTNYDYFVFVGERSDGEIRQEDVAGLHDMMNNIQSEYDTQIIDRIPLDYVIDGRKSVKDPVGMFGKKLSSTFNFVLASTTVLDRMDKALQALNIHTRRTFANALASAEAVLLPEEKEIGVAVVDMGAGTTDVSVWSGGAVRFVRSIPLGAADINHDIQQQGILEKRVEELKKGFGVAMADLVAIDKRITIAGRSPREKQDISQRNLAIIIENRLREIIGYVMAEIGDSGYADRLKGGIVLTGGGSQLEGIDALFSRQTGMEVRLALPDVNVAEDSVAFAQDPANATVIGLLLKAAQQSPSVARNFVPEKPRIYEPSKEVVQPLKPEPPKEVRPPKPEPPRVAEEVKKPPMTNNPDFEDDEDAPVTTGRGGKLKGFFKNWMNNIMPETLDGDEDI